MIIKEGDIVRLYGWGNRWFRVLAITKDNDMLVQYVNGKPQKVITNAVAVKQVKII